MKLYKKSEIWFAVIAIVIYVMVMGNMQANFGAGSVYSAGAMVVIAGALMAFIIRNDLTEKYGLKRPKDAKKALYFVPLALIATVNLWFGVKMHYDPLNQCIAAVTMVLTGIAEEIIFRGLLFRAMEKNDVKSAIIVSSVTFGAGHIVNLFTGEATVDTVLQVLYAIAIGFALVMVVYKTGSLIPCAITHSVINMTAEFSGEGSTALMYVQVVFLIIVAGGYAVYLAKQKEYVKA